MSPLVASLWEKNRHLLPKEDYLRNEIWEREKSPEKLMANFSTHFSDAIAFVCECATSFQCFTVTFLFQFWSILLNFWCEFRFTEFIVLTHLQEPVLLSRLLLFLLIFLR